jgi:hypothetical protein
MMSRLTGYSQEYDVPTNSGGTFWTAMIYSPSHCVKSAFYGNYNQPRPVYLGAIPPASLPSGGPVLHRRYSRAAG